MGLPFVDSNTPASQLPPQLRAKRMRAFYEPAYFGSVSGYGEDFGAAFADTPTQMGGFQLPREGTGGQTQFGPMIEQALRAKLAYDAPPVADVSRYGMGQLKKYGLGALEAYAPLTRESNLRWR